MAETRTVSNASGLRSKSTSNLSTTMITAFPDVRNFKCISFPDGMGVTLTGHFCGSTRYTIKFKRTMVDIWNQKFDETEVDTYIGACSLYFSSPLDAS